jgi:hypothetical protein
VGGVVDFLAAEVPDVEADVFAVDVDGPGVDGEAVGLGFVGVVVVVEEAVDQGGFADASLADEEEFCFVEGADFAAAELVEVVEDVSDGTGVFVKFGRTEDLGGDGEGIAAKVEFF